MLDIDAKAAEKTAAEIRGEGYKAQAFALDVTDRQACHTVAKQVAAKAGHVSILVNCAGITRRNAFIAVPDTVAKDWQDIMAINLNGTFNVTQALLGALRAAKGRVVNIGSIQSFVNLRIPSSTAYTASKHGVLGFTKALAAELGKDGVRVNNPELVKIFIDHTPLGRAGKPEDIVGPAIFLASDLSAYITCTIVMADGGYRTV